MSKRHTFQRTTTEEEANFELSRLRASVSLSTVSEYTINLSGSYQLFNLLTYEDKSRLCVRRIAELEREIVRIKRAYKSLAKRLDVISQLSLF